MTTLLNRIKTKIGNSPGTSGSITIGTAEDGFQTFTASEDGITTDILITEGNEWELRKDCTYTHSTTTLTRGTLVDQSSAFAFTSAAVVSVVLLSERVPQSTISTPTTGQVLKYNGTNWANETITDLTTLTGGISTADYVTFDTSVAQTPAIGKLTWDQDNGTLQVGLTGGNVNLQIGQEQVIKVYNSTATTLNDGEVVYVIGAQGNTLSVARADNTSETLSSVTIGMVTEAIASHSTGFITTSGLVNGLNTFGLTEGAAIWLGTAGAYTTTKPTAPDHAVLVGYIVRAHAVNGSIFVHIQNGYELEELHNFSQSGAFIANGQALVYDQISGVWTNSNNTVPDQAGNEFLFLTTDGTVTSWAAPTASIPSYLYTSSITTPPAGSGVNSIVIGEAANGGTQGQAVVIGKSAVADSQSGIAIGANVNCTNNASMAFGGSATAGFARSFGGSATAGYALAYGGTASASYSLSLGQNCTASGVRSIAIGHGTSLSGVTPCNAAGATSIAIGAGAQTASGVTSAIAIGYEARVSAASNTPGHIAIGSAAYTLGGTSAGCAISIGAGRSGSTVYGALQSRAIAMGSDVIAGAIDAISIGNYSTASGSGSIAIGASFNFNGGAQSTATGTIAIGQGASAATTTSIAIGNGAKCSTGTKQIVIDSSGSGLTHTGARQVIIVSDSPAYTNLGTLAIGYYPGTCAADNANLIGGGYNVISSGSTYSSCVASQQAQTFMVGEQAYACGQFATAGDAQNSKVVARIVTSTAAATELGLYASTDKIKLINDSTYLFDCDIVARNTATDTESKVWNLKFGMRRGAAAANTALIGTATKTVYGEDTGTSAWDISVTADTTNGRPNISVTGEAAKTIRWVASIRITKVTG